MSKVTKDQMLEWLKMMKEIKRIRIRSWYDGDLLIYNSLRALIEKYGDLTDDVVTATSITMEEERKKIRSASWAKLSNRAADIVSDIASNHPDVAFMGKDVKTVKEGLTTLLLEFGITVQKTTPFIDI